MSFGRETASTGREAIQKVHKEEGEGISRRTQYQLIVISTHKCVLAASEQQSGHTANPATIVCRHVAIYMYDACCEIVTEGKDVKKGAPVWR